MSLLTDFRQSRRQTKPNLPPISINGGNYHDSGHDFTDWSTLPNFRYDGHITSLKSWFGVIKEKGARDQYFWSYPWIFDSFFSLFLGVDRNDIPLLMAVASAHTPNLRSSLALIPQ